MRFKLVEDWDVQLYEALSDAESTHVLTTCKNIIKTWKGCDVKINKENSTLELITDDNKQYSFIQRCNSLMTKAKEFDIILTLSSPSEYNGIFNVKVDNNIPLQQTLNIK